MGKLGIAIALAALLMAGCSTPASDEPGTTGNPTLLDVPTGLVVAGAFAFNHTGGDLSFTLVSGAANLTVFGPDDARVGAFRLTPAAPRHDMPASPGEIVLVAARETLQAGGFAISSGAVPVQSVRRLPVVSGFVVLGEDDSALSQTVPELFGPRVRLINLTIDSPPMANLAVLVTGQYQNLEVELHGDAGALISAKESGGGFGPALPALAGHATWQLPATTYAQNASGRRVAGTLRYDGLDGAVIFTWTSFSRAGHSQLVRGHDVARDDSLFSYGTLPEGPVEATVHPGASQILLLGPDDEGPAAVVQVWDTDDRRLGPFEVPAGGNISIPLDGGGQYVFLVLNGTVDLAADRTPADFELHPLQVIETEYPQRRAGANGEFGVQMETMDVSGIPFALAETSLRPATLQGFCWDDVQLQVLEEGRTIGSNGPGGWWQAAVFMGDGELVLRSTGFGEDGCTQAAVVVSSFLRS